MQTEWTPRPGTDDWERRIDETSYCYVHQYENSDDCCWQVARSEGRLSGLIRGRDASMAKAEAVMALPVDEFKARVVAEMIDKMREIERDIVRLAPATDILPGYHAGYEAGVAAMKRKIEAVMEAEPC